MILLFSGSLVWLQSHYPLTLSNRYEFISQRSSCHQAITIWLSTLLFASASSFQRELFLDFRQLAPRFIQSFLAQQFLLLFLVGHDLGLNFPPGKTLNYCSQCQAQLLMYPISDLEYSTTKDHQASLVNSSKAIHFLSKLNCHCRFYSLLIDQIWSHFYYIFLYFLYPFCLYFLLS